MRPHHPSPTTHIYPHEREAQTDKDTQGKYHLPASLFSTRQEEHQDSVLMTGGSYQLPMHRSPSCLVPRTENKMAELPEWKLG